MHDLLIKLCSYYCEKVTLEALLLKQYPDIQFTFDTITGCKDLSVTSTSYGLIEITVERNTLAMNVLVDLMESSNAFHLNGSQYETISMSHLRELLSKEVVVPFTFVE